MHAVINNNCPIAKNLLSHGANPNSIDKLGNTVLSLAWTVEMVDCLLLGDANPNTVDHKTGFTPLHTCVRYSKIVARIIQEKVKIDAQDFTGDTPLIIATRESWISSVKVLLQAGANPNLQNNKGQTALHCAKTHRMTALLLNFGAKILPDRFGRTPLHEIISYGDTKALNLLLVSSKEYSIHKAKNGMTPLCCASMFFRKDMIIELLKAGVNTKNVDYTLCRLNEYNSLYIEYSAWSIVELLEENLLWQKDDSIKTLSHSTMIEKAREESRLLRPIVDPRYKHCRARLYGPSMLVRLPWHLRVDILRYVTTNPIQPGWGDLEFV
jgi:ankyrin repeat protein